MFEVLCKLSNRYSLSLPIKIYSQEPAQEERSQECRQTERVRLSHSLTILGNSVYKQDRILFGYVCCEIAPV